MKQAVYERKRKGKTSPAEDLAECLTAIEKLEAADRLTASRLHELLMQTVPAFAPKTWYGMPAYQFEGRLICFFQAAGKFKTRYSTLGFTDKATLDDGNFWPNAYALTALNPDVEAQITELVLRAIK